MTAAQCQPAHWPANLQPHAKPEKPQQPKAWLPDDSGSLQSLALRAIFVYLRGADAVPELRACDTLSLVLPPRAGALHINGELVPSTQEACVFLRRERSGSFIASDGLQFSGVLPFELGRSSGDAERPERWFLGSLHSTRCVPAAPGEASSDGWALELSSSALGTPCAVGPDVRVDVEILVRRAAAAHSPYLLVHALHPVSPERLGAKAVVRRLLVVFRFLRSSARTGAEGRHACLHTRRCRRGEHDLQAFCARDEAWRALPKTRRHVEILERQLRRTLTCLGGPRFVSWHSRQLVRTCAHARLRCSDRTPRACTKLFFLAACPAPGGPASSMRAAGATAAFAGAGVHRMLCAGA